MVAHALDWGDSLNRCHRGGKRNTMVMMFVGGIVLMFDKNFATGREFFFFTQTHSSKVVKKAGTYLRH
jgi:hypothetical protein